VFACPAYVGVVMTTFGVCSSLPPTPPSTSAAVPLQQFSAGVKQVLFSVFLCTDVESCMIDYV